MSVEILPVHGLPEIEPGADLAGAILGALQAQQLELREGDVVVVTQKIVSKAEGCIILLDSVTPSDLAITWAERFDKDPRVVELALRESKRIVRMDRGVLICETRHGFVCANAGVDQSNVGSGQVTLLPPDPDASAERIRLALQARVGVVITDTFGRAWREGQTNVAIGVAGIQPLRNFEGVVDPTGYQLRVTLLATADEIAGAAELVMGKLDRVPVALVRGVPDILGSGTAQALVRPPMTDLFR
jgi:coenzyme F420-0:L-glutamate ligase / coenzyme F420-1:gamma-L-glutamate ligase